MKKFIVVGLLSLCPSVWATQSPFGLDTADNNTLFTLYLVRHGEKQTNDNDPDLTECGEKRAMQIATLLDKVKLEKIYSTNYKRTIATAQPTAVQYSLDITQYNPKDLSNFAKTLTENKHTALIVGHSNTTPKLASLLTNSFVNDMTELEYQRLYQIQFANDVPNLVELTQPLTCEIVHD